VVVAGGVARLKRDGSIAGSTLTMAAAVRQALRAGLSIVEVAMMAATTPAKVLGLDKRLAVGCDADLVVLDEQLQVTRVVRAGREQ
jgi:N-acetylglucosamine-6-phosphate deacetylase